MLIFSVWAKDTVKCSSIGEQIILIDKATIC